VLFGPWGGAVVKVRWRAPTGALALVAAGLIWVFGARASEWTPRRPRSPGSVQRRRVPLRRGRLPAAATRLPFHVAA